MPYLQTSPQQFDAIVIGSGVSGGWAAKELCEKGLKTLVLERGREVKPLQDYPTMSMDPWELPHRGSLTADEEKAYFVQNRSGFIGAGNKHFYARDIDFPYQEEKRFDWIRGHQTGGRSLIWGRQCYRWSDLDFTANARESIGVDWPIRYKDIEPWYDYVEKFVGVSGEKLGLPHLPDGQFQPPMELNCLERHLKGKIESNFPGRHLTIGRVANLTQELNGRGPCQFRNRCDRGCPYGAYFSSVSVTLPAAQKTGNLTMRNNSIVREITYDETTGKVKGVKVIDAVTKEETEYTARVIFCNASTMGTTFILMNSLSKRFPNGLGNDSGELGHNIMDHHYRTGAYGEYEGFEDQTYEGRRPNGIYIPRYHNLDAKTKNAKFLRGFGYQGGGSRGGWGRGSSIAELGADFKDSLFKPGGWNMFLSGFGECLPRHENKVSLNHDTKDPWGLPQLSFDAAFGENEKSMRVYMANDAAEMLEAAGFKKVNTYDAGSYPGLGIHEMGTARMGRDPKTSILNAHNQLHAVPNLFVTDGACMTSSGCQNPSITYMALTARAVDHAVSELKRQNI